MRDQETLPRLFNEYRDRCYGFFIELLKDRELAKDLTQDVFASLIRKKEFLNVVQEWENYIYAMCRNLAYDHLKKAARQQKYSEYLSRYGRNANKLLRPNQAEKGVEAPRYEKLLD